MPALSTQSPDLVRWSLLIVGGLYATFLAVKYGVKVLLRRAGRRYANTETLSELWDVAVSSWSVIYILWHAVHLLERVFRSIALSILGPGSMATNIVFAGTGAGASGILLFDVSFVIFVVCVMLGFHTLATWYSAAKLTESVSTDAKVRTLHSSVVSGQGRIEPLRDRRRAMSECWDSGPSSASYLVYPLA